MPQLDDRPNPGPRSGVRMQSGWAVVIPVKPAAAGKSRLRLPLAHRQEIIRAIALDTIEAAAACAGVRRVVVVTADEPLTAAVTASRGVDVVRDSAGGLREAIGLGLAATGTGSPRAVLLGDLPALKPQELAAALAQAARHDLAFVPDADGTGTVLATALADMPFRPLFGADSAAAHREAGFEEVAVPVAWGLRRDLDTTAHLPALRRAGLGRHTARLLGSGADVGRV